MSIFPLSVTCIYMHPCIAYKRFDAHILSGLLDVKQSGSDGLHTMDRGDYRWVDGSPLVFTKWYAKNGFAILTYVQARYTWASSP